MLRLQIFNNAYDLEVNNTIDLLELEELIRYDKDLKKLTDKYQYGIKNYNPDNMKAFKKKSFKQLSLIKYNNKRVNNNFIAAYGFVIDIDKKDNPRKDLKIKFNEIRKLNAFNVGFMSLSGGIKLLRFFNATISNYNEYKLISKPYIENIEKRFNLNVDLLGYKHTYINHSEQVFFNNNIDNLDLTFYKKKVEKLLIEEEKRSHLIQKQREITPMINNMSPLKTPNLKESIIYMSNITYTHKEYMSIAYALYNSFGANALHLWELLNNNSYYDTEKDHKESIYLWNKVSLTAGGYNDYRAVITIAMKYGFTPKGFKAVL